MGFMLLNLLPEIYPLDKTHVYSLNFVVWIDLESGWRKFFFTPKARLLKWKKKEWKISLKYFIGNHIMISENENMWAWSYFSMDQEQKRFGWSQKTYLSLDLPIAKKTINRSWRKKTTWIRQVKQKIKHKIWNSYT